MTEPLTGQKLLETLDKMPANASKSERCRACGYVTPKKDGGERLNFTAFYGALLDAKGVPTGSDSKKRGRPLSYSTTVLGAGHAVIGSRYIEQIGADPGDQVQIKVDRRRLILTLGG